MAITGRGFIQIEATNIRDIRGRFAAIRDKEAVEFARELARESGRILVDHLKEEAPVGKHYTFEGTEYEPARRLRDSFFYRTYVRGKTIRLSIYSKAGDILRYVARGTRPHPITPRQPGGLLAFYWAKEKKSVIVSSVEHPGTLANRFHVRAYKKAEPELEKRRKRMALRMARAMLWEASPEPLQVV
jgi:hypothetical protein